MNSKILIITGMHRSGTSLVTHWLNSCGLFIGKRLFPGDVGNIEGHFEDSDFLELHQQFLAKRKCAFKGFIDKEYPKLIESEKRQLKDLIEMKSNEHKEWGWKDPRNCLFLDEYNGLIPDAFYLFIVRDHCTTVNSMLMRENKVHIKRFQSKKGLSRIKWILFKKKSSEEIYKTNADSFLKMWIYYYERIINHIRSLPPERYILINYSYLIRNDKNVLARLKNEWQFSLKYFPFTSVYKKELLSKEENIAPYIKDLKLISKAKELEKKISEFFIRTNEKNNYDWKEQELHFS